MFTNLTRRQKYFAVSSLSALAGSTVVWYKLHDPIKVISNSTMNKFNNTHSYSAKKMLYNYLPEPSIPKNDKDTMPSTVQDWANLVSVTYNNVNGSILYKTKNSMRKTLLEHINDIPDTHFRIKELKSVIPDSLELEIILEKILIKEMREKKCINAEILNECMIESKTTNSIEAKLVEAGLLTFPGNLNDLLHILLNKMPVGDYSKETNIIKSIEIIKNQYDLLSPEIQDHVLKSVLLKLLNILKKNPDGDKLFDNMIREQLVNEISQNELLKPHIESVITFFKKLPTHIQAKMIHTIIKHKNEDSMKLIKMLINDGGIVLIKLGQILAEDPKTPEKYREFFQEFLDSNSPVNIIEYWSSITKSVRQSTNSLGEFLGAGSVKQAHIINYEDKQLIISIVYKRVEDDIFSVLQALKTFTQISNLIDRTGDLVSKELNLWSELKAFEQLNTSEFGKSPHIYIPKIYAAGSSFLIREYIEGNTLSKILKNKENRTPEILSALETTQRMTIRAAFGGKVASDFHLGNMIYDYKKKKIVLIDPGQFETMTKHESTALLWLMVAMSDNYRMKIMKNEAVSHLVELSYSKKFSSQERKDIEIAISKAYTKCESIEEPRKRVLMFLNEVAGDNICMPSSYYACAKMLDIIMSQKKVLDLTDVVSSEIASLFKSRITWAESASLLTKSYFG